MFNRVKQFAAAFCGSHQPCRLSYVNRTTCLNSLNSIPIALESVSATIVLLSGLSPINSMETPKCLDVKLDFKLNYKLHITLVEDKVARSVGILSKPCYLFLSTALLLLYYSSGHGMEWNGIERKFRYGIWKTQEWNGRFQEWNERQSSIPIPYLISLMAFTENYIGYG